MASLDGTTLQNEAWHDSILEEGPKRLNTLRKITDWLETGPIRNHRDTKKWLPHFKKEIEYLEGQLNPGKQDGNFQQQDVNPLQQDATPLQQDTNPLQQDVNPPQHDANFFQRDVNPRGQANGATSCASHCRRKHPESFNNANSCAGNSHCQRRHPESFNNTNSYAGTSHSQRSHPQLAPIAEQHQDTPESAGSALTEENLAAHTQIESQRPAVSGSRRPVSVIPAPIDPQQQHWNEVEQQEAAQQAEMQAQMAARQHSGNPSYRPPTVEAVTADNHPASHHSASHQPRPRNGVVTGPSVGMYDSLSVRDVPPNERHRIPKYPKPEDNSPDDDYTIAGTPPRSSFVRPSGPTYPASAPARSAVRIPDQVKEGRAAQSVGGRVHYNTPDPFTTHAAGQASQVPGSQVPQAFVQPESPAQGDHQPSSPASVVSSRRVATVVSSAGYGPRPASQVPFAATASRAPSAARTYREPLRGGHAGSRASNFEAEPPNYHTDVPPDGTTVASSYHGIFSSEYDVPD
ncbi:hypothetical protein M8818_006415 [Zalaria obscura]|uniref:Uncharacterized protein n=1 Tax=Zalaria obscura TaxID=2024903 RepID=A0ACC3S6E1_9PEZI